MRRALLSLGLLAGLGACGVNSEADCRTACNWWGTRCTSESVSSCVTDCLETTESASEANTRCVAGAGWTSAPDCRSASCCLRWVYSDDSFRRECL